MTISGTEVTNNLENVTEEELENEFQRLRVLGLDKLALAVDALIAEKRLQTFQNEGKAHLSEKDITDSFKRFQKWKIVPLKEVLDELYIIQQYTFEKDFYEGTDNLGLMEIEMSLAINFIKEFPEGRPLMPESKSIRANTIGKSSIYIVYSYDKKTNQIYLLKIRDYSQRPLRPKWH